VVRQRAPIDEDAAQLVHSALTCNARLSASYTERQMETNFGFATACCTSAVTESPCLPADVYLGVVIREDNAPLSVQ
jgi:hypothetical protein